MSSCRTISGEDDLQAGFFIACAGMLLAIGILMVYSSSVTANPSEEELHFLTRQLLFLLVSGVSGIAVSQVPARFWRRLAPVIYGGTVCLLFLVLVPGIGSSVNGAQRWIRIGALSIQPSETAKLSVPLLLCSLVSQCRSNERWTPPAMTKYIALTLLPMFLILVEPDLGTALFIGMAAGLALWLSGCPIRYFLTVGLAAAPVGLLLVILRPYQLRRIQGFVDTWLHPEAAPYQVRQSLTTLGAGGVGGVGLGQGWQKLSFLPEANTDFVLAVVGEELGVVGTLGVLALWVGVYWTGFKLVQRIPGKSFERILALTLLASLVIQAFINMGVVTALLPPKGISHPLISYGGSSLVMSLISLGVIVSLTRSNDSGDDQSNAPCEAETGQ